MTAFSAVTDNYSNAAIQYDSIFTCSRFWKAVATALQNNSMLKFALEFYSRESKCICFAVSILRDWMVSGKKYLILVLIHQN